MIARLLRYQHRRDCTLGILVCGDFRCHTIERPWIPVDGHPGGKPFESCIGEGTYTLEPFTRPNGDEVYQIINTELAVYEQEADMGEEGGRYLVLIHAGNWAKDVVGCVAPGLGCAIDNSNNNMVTSSKSAMRKIMAELGCHVHNSLVIENL